MYNEWQAKQAKKGCQKLYNKLKVAKIHSKTEFNQPKMHFTAIFLAIWLKSSIGLNLCLFIIIK